MRAFLIYLFILFCGKCYAQGDISAGINFDTQAESVVFSGDGKYAAIFFKNEIQVLDLADQKILEKYDKKFLGDKVLFDVKFSYDNKFIYGLSHQGFFIINRNLKKAKLVPNRNNIKTGFYENFDRIDYVKGIFKIKGTQCKYAVTNGVNNCLNKYFIFDYSGDTFLASTSISTERYNNLRYQINDDEKTRMIMFNDFEYSNIEIYKLQNNEELISRYFNPKNSIVSLIIKNENGNYKDSGGKIVLFSLKKNEIKKIIPVNVEHRFWTTYDGGAQISDNEQILVYSTGKCINKLDLVSGKTEQLVCLDRPQFVYDAGLSRIYYCDYYIIHKIGALGIGETRNEGLSVNFSIPTEKLTATSISKQKIELCISNPKLLQYKSIDYYLNGQKISDRDFEIVKSTCISAFSKVMDLREGQNTFEVVVLDQSGNEINRERRIINYAKKENDTPIINPIPNIITEKRLALVVGNSNYNNGNNLPNPANDADSLDLVLSSLNFKVIKIKNQSKQQLETAIKKFAVQLKDYDVGLFFYAGHGMEFNGENYIIPVDAEKLDKSDVQYRCVSTSWLQEKMAEAGAYNKTNIVILDACRNNPFRSWRSFDDSNIWVPPSNVPTGTIVEYAASQGQKASDGHGSNGAYTSILLKHIRTKGLEIEKVFKRVRIDLKQKGGQDPVELNQLTKDFYFVK
ncbi:MAG: caspase family protein [Sphingobacteriaceae bacterium]|nr:caspase family protein [Sphingobacteriaceae bacterium]